MRGAGAISAFYRVKWSPMLSNRHRRCCTGGPGAGNARCALASICRRPVSLSLGGGFSQLAHLSPQTASSGQIVWSVSLPRIIMAAAGGMRFDRADPRLTKRVPEPAGRPLMSLASTSGSAFGGTLAILLGLRHRTDDDLDLSLPACWPHAGIYLIAALQGRRKTRWC